MKNYKKDYNKVLRNIIYDLSVLRDLNEECKDLEIKLSKSLHYYTQLRNYNKGIKL